MELNLYVTFLMSKLKQPLNQLSFLQTFDKEKLKREKLSSDLLEQIKSWKYYRTATRCAHVPGELVDGVDSVLMALCGLAASVSTVESQDLAFYRNAAREKNELYMQEPPDLDVLRDYYHTGSIRVKGILRSSQAILPKSALKFANHVLAAVEKLTNI